MYVRRLSGMTDPQSWPQNRLLLALSSRDLKQLLPQLTRIPCRREQVLTDADSSLDHVYFPDSGVVSVVAVYSDGSIIEMATIGREGCTGVQAVFGAKTSSARFFVQIPGSAAQMSRAAFTRTMRSVPSFRRLAFAYVQAFQEQVMVSAGCNGAHSLKQRLARWLLMMRDRSDADTLLISQDLLADMLGVQRPSITNTAAELERAGLIRRGREQVTIVNRQGLMAASCECYQLVRSRIAHHLPKTYPET
jgi:CRP-like cAMP-binding protein